jgi:hypothetical protein
MINEKLCSKCKATKSFGEFYPVYATGELSHQCKKCQNNRRAINSIKMLFRVVRGRAAIIQEKKRLRTEASLKRKQLQEGAKPQRADEFHKAIKRRLSQTKARANVDKWDSKIATLLAVNKRRQGMRDRLLKPNAAIFLKNKTGSGAYSCRWAEACSIQLKKISQKQARDIWLNKIRNTLSNHRKRLREIAVARSQRGEGFAIG